jgi:hypothetical protein
MLLQFKLALMDPFPLQLTHAFAAPGTLSELLPPVVSVMLLTRRVLMG